MPSEMMPNRSLSVGGWPEALVRTLYFPWVKSRGFGSSRGAAGPLPSPCSPWQRRHFFS